MSTWVKQKKKDWGLRNFGIHIYVHTDRCSTPFAKLGNPGQANKIRYPTFTYTSFVKLLGDWAGPTTTFNLLLCTLII